MIDYLPILAMFILAGIFAGVSFFASRMLAPQRPTAAKEAPYECGIVPEREPAERFPVRFYLVAMIFIIFDIEIIFVYPWAVIYRQLGAFGLWEFVLFAVAVFVSFVFLIGNGALDWGPLKRIRPVAGLPESMRSPERTAATTVKRVDVGRQEPAA
ncbi:MAG TPA: NADH-quinone oxidoreductase subunit A [Acidimicrobiales bacterium]|nr:NADH-quinone oxidoreductase subunit A [Acidimicrobiales bacterium]